MITDYTRLINKEYPLPPDYVPPDLIDIGLPFDCAPSNPKRLLEKRTAYAASELICRSQHEGISLCCISGYRSYDRQKELFRGSSYVAAPGTSEHQSGLALIFPVHPYRWSLQKNSEILRRDAGLPPTHLFMDLSFAILSEKKTLPGILMTLAYPFCHPNPGHLPYKNRHDAG